MNYIREITAFNQWAADQALSPSERILWYALMDIANSTGWKPSFNAAVSGLIRLTGMSKNTIYAARNKLAERGVITVESRPGGLSAVYSMTSISNFLYQNEDERVPNQGHADEASCTKSGTRSYQNRDTDTTPLYQNRDTLVPKEGHEGTEPVPNQGHGQPDEKTACTKIGTVVYQNRDERVPNQGRYLNINNLNKNTSTTSSSYARAREDDPQDGQDDGMPFGLTQEDITRSMERMSRIEDAVLSLGLPFKEADIQRAEKLAAEYSDDWLLQAIDRTGLRERRSWGTIIGILRSWKERGGIDDAYGGTKAIGTQPGDQRTQPGHQGDHSQDADDGRRGPRTGLQATRL